LVGWPKRNQLEKKSRSCGKEVRRHEDLYYVRDNPEISDAEYDQLLEKLQKLEQGTPRSNNS